MILDFDSQILFGNAPPPPRFLPHRGVQSNAIPTMKRFCKIAGEGCDAEDIAGRIACIEDAEELTEADKQELDNIDQDITAILLHAD